MTTYTQAGQSGDKRVRKRPTQSRSRAMVELILQTTQIVLREEGYEAVTTNRIAERAGISVGSVYQYFPDKAAIVVELQRRHHGQLTGIMAAAFAEAAALNLADATRCLVRAALDAHYLDPTLHKVLADVVPSVINRPTRQAAQKGIEAQLCIWLSRHVDDIRVSDIALAAFIIRNLVESVTHAAVIDPPEVGAKVDIIEDQLTRMILAYLSGQSALQAGNSV